MQPRTALATALITFIICFLVLFVINRIKNLLSVIFYVKCLMFSNMYFSILFSERVKSTLSEMGVAVFNGGVSTFLAFIVVAFSKSYVFTTFFKVSFTLSYKTSSFEFLNLKQLHHKQNMFVIRLQLDIRDESRMREPQQ